MIDAISSALSGITSATRSVNTAVKNIADPNSGSDLIEDIVDIKVAEVQFKANVQTIKVADELTQELLNIFDKKV